jgi:hypothetical protein
MLFRGSSDLIFLETVNLVSKAKQKPFSIVRLADPVTYENVDFFPRDVKQFEKLARGEVVQVAIDYDGKFTNLVREDV